MSPGKISKHEGGRVRADSPSQSRAGARRLPKKANWSAWRGESMVLLRDAVALSLDFEPETVTLEHRDFAQRLKVAVAHFRERRILKLNIQDRSSLHTPLTPVWVPHFAAWAKSKPKWHLPPELQAVAQQRLSASDKGAVSAGQRRAAQAKTWQEAVRHLADELHMEDVKAGREASLKEIAERTAAGAAKHSIAGPRGELSAENILRAALAGGRWTRPKPKKAGAKKVVVQKAAARKSAVKKAVTKKTAAKKAAPKKADVKKAGVKKAAEKNTPARQRKTATKGARGR